MIVGLLVDEVESGPERIRFEGKEGPLHVGVAGARDHRVVRWRSWIGVEEDGDCGDEENSEQGGGKDAIRDDIA